nr:D-alanyl-D-alanine carboxypeptidase family protein [Bradyrhizobium sp. AUGA SZCCT0222]
MTDPAQTLPPVVPTVQAPIASTANPEVAVAATAAPDKQQTIVVAALSDPAEILPPEIPTIAAPTAGMAAAATTPGRVELVGECQLAEACIDQFLWALYQRTPKEDTTKERELRKVTIKRKGKLVTVTRSFTKLVDNDFTWKDPKAAERVGMPMMDYVIGGMDRSFKMKLFHTLYAAEAAGLRPGITSAFRDDYRQSIASGLKAAANRSFHGGSLRGGYGRGLAADIVSVNGVNRSQRWASTETLWKWVDANGKQFGIGRPYLAFDPPHVGPIDGPEYASRRGGTKTAAADAKKRQKQVAQAKPSKAKASTAKRQVAAKPPGSKPSSRLAAAR